MAQRVAGGEIRRWPIVLGVAILSVLALLSLTSIYYLDLLWFREVGFSGVFWGVIAAKASLAFAVGLAFFLLLYGNLLIVRRTAPRYRVLSPEQEIIERYRLAFEPWLKWLIPGFCLVLAVIAGVGAMEQWRTVLLFRNSGGLSFGVTDPLFGRDVSYYVFGLPFWHLLQGWLFSMLVAVTLLTGVGHYLWGGIRPQAASERVTPQVKAHLSVLLGLILLVKAWGYWLGRFDLLTSPRGTVTGASYTDVNAQLPALNFLILAAVVCAILFFVNIRLRGWGLPVIAVGLLVLVSVVIGGLFPAFVQKFRVDPQEYQQEKPFIQRNIEYTRRAFGLDGITTTNTAPSPSLTPDDIAQNGTTVGNIRLWDPALLQLNYQQLQRIKQYYEFEDVDVDRYTLGGERRLVMASAREISQKGIPSQGATWQNTHLVYTHGYGAVASQVNGATVQGSPLFILQDIPPTGTADQAGSEDLAASLNAGQPRVYYGERADVPFLVVDSASTELDYQGTATDDNKQVTYNYQGTGGIPIGGLFNKILFAWRFRDVNLLISNLITDQSRVMMFRSISERVPKAAPFLKLDGDPYVAVVDGRIKWIWDAYTTTDRYPYSEEIDLGALTGGQLGGTTNYMRNSVKVVVDAYDGTMTYYVTDPQDPIIQAWSRAFPDLFTPKSEASAELQSHFRYPENLFQVQAQQWANYHVTDPAVFYQKQDFWAVPTDPTVRANGLSGDSTLRPYYQLMRLPGQDSEEFVLILPLTPQGRQNMVAWMAARSDIGHYGEMVTFEFPAGRNVDGPTQVFNQIQSYPPFSQEATLLSQGGSRVLYGNLLVVPLGNSFLYVQPVFVQSSQENAFPELKRVVVVHGGKVGIGTTLDEALLDSGLGDSGEVGAGGTGGNGQQGTGEVGLSSADLLAQALTHFDKANEALKAGDLATYQAEIDEAEALIKQAVAQSAGSSLRTGGGSGAASPSPIATPTAPASP